MCPPSPQNGITKRAQNARYAALTLPEPEFGRPAGRPFASGAEDCHPRFKSPRKYGVRHREEIDKSNPYVMLLCELASKGVDESKAMQCISIAT